MASSMTIAHESIERQPSGLIIAKTPSISYVDRVMAVDYYDEFKDICSLMRTKYGPKVGCTGSHHVCAYISAKGDRIVLGENSTRTMVPGHPGSTHAEMDVLRKVTKSLPPTTHLKRVEKYDVLVVRFSKTHRLGSSRPCMHCIMSMQEASSIKIRYVYYSTPDGKVVREKLDEMLDTDLTIVSTGWRTVLSKRASCASDDSSSDDGSVSSSKSKSSNSSNSSSRSSSTERHTIISPASGERVTLTDRQYAKLVLKAQKKKSE